MSSPEQAEAAAQQAQQMQEMQAKKHAILKSLLTPAAYERLSRLEMVKPESAMMIQNHLITQAQNGQIVGEVDEDTIKNLLASFAQQNKAVGNIRFQRKTYGDKGSDDEDDDSDDHDLM